MVSERSRTVIPLLFVSVGAVRIASQARNDEIFYNTDIQPFIKLNPVGIYAR